MDQLLSPLVIKLRLGRLPVIRQRALWPNSVWPLKDPVLPGRQATVDLRVHRLWSGETQRCLHTGQGVGRKRRAFFNCQSNLVFPVQIIRRESDESGFFGSFSVERTFARERF